MLTHPLDVHLASATILISLKQARSKQYVQRDKPLTFLSIVAQGVVEHQPGVLPCVLLPSQAAKPRSDASQIKVAAQVPLRQGLWQQQVVPMPLRRVLWPLPFSLRLKGRAAH